MKPIKGDNVKPTAASARAASEMTPTKGNAKITTIEAKIDVGFGNTLFMRGEGGGLDWEHGIPLKCVDSRTWRWSGPIKEKLAFKLLLNDAVWSQGQDLVIKPGERIQVTPTF